MAVKLRIIDFEVPLSTKGVFDVLAWTAQILHCCEARGDDHNFQIVIAGPRLYVSACWIDENGQLQSAILADGKSDRGGFSTLDDRVLDGLVRAGIVIAEEGAP